ncbi:ice-binding family protein [Sphaerochaeta globosa]|uniref:Ig domain protein group 2 domain protein n=1 Tax=Sphaerochaeta globosa (strain ATCC BAA-1886 / DSM 22777 / Buddy) TaxID=158189 RepID=F0RY29_SPHGB|nr:ice-binding family protein [Sphaerochaeta globosa]ADY12453.1 Ig domain protein group 2 domain protein [Sphaerochaeta globosa str. Buddy]
MSTTMKYLRILTTFVILLSLTFLVGCSEKITPPISVASITVNGAGDAITVVDGSTLQMSAVVLPNDALDASFTWSVQAGTGLATISESGLLTATEVGSVSVIATANDGSTITGSLEVTVTAYTGLPSPMASFAGITLTQTGDIANNNVQYAEAAAVIAVLPIQISVTLEDAQIKNVPLTWLDTDTYNPAVAADYTFTAVWGDLPVGATNANNLAVPTVELAVRQGVLMVASITVTTDGDIVQVILDETLQMNKTVAPLTAEDTSVTWSVAAGTGTASIDIHGLLLGLSEGTVIVKATANDDSLVEGTKMITVNARPLVASTFPLHEATGVAITTDIQASFNEIMDGDSVVIPANFIVSAAGSEISGVLSYDVANRTVSFNPSTDLLYDTLYTATISAAVTDFAGAEMLEDKVWTFTTASAVLAGVGPALINLRTASNFAILAKSAITNTGNTLITGDIGVSPQSLVDLTGFSETLSLDGTSADSIYVTGKIYASDMQAPTPSKLTTAISDVEAAYVEAAGRVDYAIVSGTAGGIIGGQTFAPGIYKWETVVTMATDITLQGGVNDVWIFQIADNLTASSGARVMLTDGAQAKNIFWQVAGIVTLGTGAHFEGIIMSMTQIVLETGSSVHGKLLAQTQVTLDTATVTPL